MGDQVGSPGSNNLPEVNESNEKILRGMIRQQLNEMRSGNTFTEHDLDESCFDKLLTDKETYNTFEIMIGKSWMDYDMIATGESGLNGGKLNKKKKQFISAVKAASDFVRQEIGMYGNSPDRIDNRAAGGLGRSRSNKLDDSDTVSSLSESKVSRTSSSLRKKKSKKHKKKKAKDKKKSRKSKKRKRDHDSKDNSDGDMDENGDENESMTASLTEIGQSLSGITTGINEEAKAEFEKEKAAIMAKIPKQIRNSFRSLGFAKWNKDWLPVMRLGPYDVAPGDVRDKWMKMLGLIHKNRTKMSELVFWFGTPKSDMTYAYSFIAQKSVVSYEEGCKKGYHEIPKPLQRRLDQGKKLSATQEQHVVGLKRINEQLNIPADKRLPWLFDFQEEYEMEIDSDQSQIGNEEGDDELIDVNEEVTKKKKKGRPKKKDMIDDDDEEEQEPKKKKGRPKKKEIVEDEEEPKPKKKKGRPKKKEILEEVEDEPEQKKKKSKQKKKDMVEEEEEVEPKKKKKKRKSDDKSLGSKKKHSKKAKNLNDIINQEVAEEDAFLREEEEEEGFSEDDEHDDDFSVNRDETDSEDDEDDELYEEKENTGRRMQKKKETKTKEAQRKRKKGETSKPVSSKRRKKEEVFDSFEEEQKKFEECERIFLPIMSNLKGDNIECAVARKYLKHIDKEVGKLTPPFIKVYKVGLLIKDLRQRFNENAEMKQLCKVLTKKMKEVYIKKEKYLPEGFEPRISKKTKDKLKVKEKDVVKQERSNNTISSSPVRKDIGRLTPPNTQRESSFGSVGNIQLTESKNVEKSKPVGITHSGDSVKAEKPKRRIPFSLAGFAEKPVQPTANENENESIKQELERDDPVQVSVQLPIWITTYPKTPRVETNIDRQLAMNFFTDACSCLPEDNNKVDPDSIARALEDTLFTTYENSSTIYWERVHDICAAIAGKKKAGSLAQKIVNGEYNSAFDVIKIPRSILFKSFEGHWIQ